MSNGSFGPMFNTINPISRLAVETFEDWGLGLRIYTSIVANLVNIKPAPQRCITKSQALEAKR